MNQPHWWNKDSTLACRDSEIFVWQESFNWTKRLWVGLIRVFRHRIWGCGSSQSIISPDSKSWAISVEDRRITLHHVATCIKSEDSHRTHGTSIASSTSWKLWADCFPSTDHNRNKGTSGLRLFELHLLRIKQFQVKQTHDLQLALGLEDCLFRVQQSGESVTEKVRVLKNRISWMKCLEVFSWH